ncbi:MAG TPA: plastocyanin/azurin family copper-binding protein [Thermoleophilaceae bacterium]|nr:plastocyanin/azurin family copper-binding protein [Thermoleophilaceae bacterium]
MRRAAIILALAATLGALPGATALAADKNVTANTTGAGGANEQNFFNPASVTVLVGDTVFWHNNSGKHNVHFANGMKLGGDPVTHSSTANNWDAQFTFTKPGTFKYWCDEHSDGSFGMVAKVVVTDPNAPPKVSDLSAKPSKFCTNKSKTCDKRGTKIKFTLSKAAKVTGQIKPKGTDKPFKTIFADKQKPAGKSSIDYAGKGLTPRKYLLRVRAKDAQGHTSKFAQTTVQVVDNG